MGYSVFGNYIKMVRGDTIKISVSMERRGDKGRYEPKEGDTVIFSVKHYMTDRHILLEKEIPIRTMMLYLTPEDTKALPIGIYYYDFQIRYKNGETDTFVENGILEICPEIG